MTPKSDESSDGGTAGEPESERDLAGDVLPAGAHDVVPPEILKALPENVRAVILEAASFSGPLPPSAMYREYEEAVPGSGDRLLAMAENQQSHRHSWENKALDATARDVKRGQRFGLIVALCCIGGAIYLAAAHGLTMVPCVMVGFGGMGLVGQFVHSFRRSSDD